MDPAKSSNLRPSARHKLIAQLAQSREKPQVAEGLQPVDYGHYLIHSLDLKAIIPALSHPYPHTRSLAINALGKAWVQLPPNEIVAAVGGATGLADVLNTVAFRDAKSIAEKLGYHYRGPDDPRTSCLDALVALMVPSIADPGSVGHPVCRLGSTLATKFLPAISPDTISQLFKFVSTKDTNRLRRLLHTQPAYVAEFLQSDYYKYSNRALCWQTADLTQLFAMRSIRGVPETQGEHWGINLFVKLLTTSSPPWLNFRPDVSGLVELGSSALYNAPSESVWNTVMQALLDRMKTEHEAGKVVTFSIWKKVILSITDKMSRSSASGVEKDMFKICLKRIGELAAGLDAGVTTLLPHLSPPIRQDVLRSLHGINNERQWSFPSDAPRIGLATVMQLKSAIGRPILRQMEPYFNDNAIFIVRGKDLPLPLMNIANELRSQPADRDDAVSVAVQGRWAFLEGDLAGQEETIQALERWKVLVHRQKQAEGRLKYTRMLLTIAAVVNDTKLLKETFAWVFERFFKDVDVRRRIFQSYMTLCVLTLAGKAENLQETAQYGDEAIGLLIDAMSKARTEPNFQAEEFNQTTSLCRKVLWERATLCQNHLIPESKTEAVITPLKALFLRAESIQLDDPGTFGKPALYPRRYNEGWHSFTISLLPSFLPKYRRLLVTFMDDLSSARDALYADKRSTMELHQDDESEGTDTDPGYYSDEFDVKFHRGADTDLGYHSDDFDVKFHRDAWPYEVTADSFKDLSLERDAPCLHRFLRKIVYTPVNAAPDDEKDICHDQWTRAIGLYAQCADTIHDRDAALRPIIQHYRTAISKNGDQIDLSPHLLNVNGFMTVVEKSEALMEEFLSPYAVAADYGQLKIFFGTPDPSTKEYKKDVNLSLFRRRRGSTSLRDMSKGLAMLKSQRISHRLRQRLAIVAIVLWIDSLRGLPDTDKGYTILADESSTLDFASIHSNAQLPNGNPIGYRWKELNGQQKTIISGLDQLSATELQNLVKTVKLLIARMENQPHRDTALRTLAVHILPKSHVPTLMEEDIFEVLADKARSSLHRDFFNGALLAVIPPLESKRLTQRFITLVSEQLSRKPDPESKEPNVKISTVKYIATCAAQPFAGLGLEEISQELESMAGQNAHPSVQETLLSMLTRIIVREGCLRPQVQLEAVWELLESLASIACSLDEKRQLTEKDWSRPTLPEIALYNQRPALIMNVQIETLPVNDRVRWTAMVESMLSLQVAQTKRWLTEFLRRHNCSPEATEFVEMTEFGPLLSCLRDRLPQSYNLLRDYLPGNSWHIRILQSQISAYLISDELFTISTQLDKSEPDWKKSQDGKDWASLLNEWSSGHQTAFRMLVSVLLKHGREEVRSSLQEACQVLLKPSCMLVSAGNHLRRSTPWEVLGTLIWELRPLDKMTKQDQEAWKTRIRPLLQWLAEYAAQTRQDDEKDQACYISLLTQINSLLLPFPFMFPDDNTSHSEFGSQLYKLALEALHQPPALQFLDSFLNQIMPRIIALSGKSVPVAKCIIQMADKEVDADRSLLGYRLVQCFTERHDLNRDEQREMKTIQINMEKHPNMMVRLLALNRARTMEEPEIGSRGAYPTRVIFRGRGRGRGRGY